MRLIYAIDPASTTPALTTCVGHATPSVSLAETRLGVPRAKAATGDWSDRGVVRLASELGGVQGCSVSADRKRKVMPGIEQPTGANGLRYVPFGVGSASGDPPRRSDFAS